MNKEHRIKKLQEALKKDSKTNSFAHEALDLFIIHDPLSLYYFTSMDLSAGRLIVTSDDAVLIVDRRYGDAARELFAENARIAQDIDQELKEWLSPRTNLTCAGIEGLKSSFSQVKKWENFFSGLRFHAADELIVSMKMIKSPKEIEIMKKAGQLTLKGFDFIRQSLKPKITEKELATNLKVFFLQNGAEGVAFDPIIAFGANTARPHHRPTHTPWKKGDAVQLDIGSKIDHYSSDFSRFLLPDNHSLDTFYQLVQKAQERALALCQPGVKLKELDDAAREVFREANVETLFGHSLGHGIGLEVHEAPFFRSPWLEMTLQEGMTLTVEPGLYQKGLGGVRLEETIVIVKQGFEICA